MRTRTGRGRMPWHRVDPRGGRWSAGTASVELALVAPILIMLFMGAWDFGRALNSSARLAGAAQAGVQFGARGPSYAADLDGMEAAAKSQVVDTTGALEAVAQQVCKCPSGEETDCNGSCGAGGAVQMFVQVQVTDSFQTWFPYPFVSNPISLSKQAIWRVN